MQAFPALEKLLYPDTDAESLLTASNAAKRCEAIQGISANLVNMSNEIVTAWSEQSANYRANFVDGTGEFTGKVDVVEEVVTNYLEHLELVKDEKLLIPVSTENLVSQRLQRVFAVIFSPVFIGAEFSLAIAINS